MMIHPTCGDSSFITTVWRKQPLLLKGAVPDTLRKGFTFQRFRAWCERADRIRVYVRTEHQGQGRAVAKKLSCGSDGLVLYDHYSSRQEPITLLLNGAEKLESDLLRLQSFFGIPYEWRRDDTVATMSAPGAGIGYHGGSEDGFIVQLEGERHWSVWSSDVLSRPYREFLCGNPFEPQADARSPVNPVLSVVLQPGDALYIPALFPHEGITRRESLSLSIGWRGISAYEALREMLTLGNRAVESLSAECAVPLFRLLEDPPPEREPSAYLVSEFARLFRNLPDTLRPTDDEIAAYVADRFPGRTPAS